MPPGVAPGSSCTHSTDHRCCSGAQSSTKQRHSCNDTIRIGSKDQKHGTCERGDSASHQGALEQAHTRSRQTAQQTRRAKAWRTRSRQPAHEPWEQLWKPAIKLRSAFSTCKQAQNGLKSIVPTDPRCVLGWESHPSEEPPPHGGRGKQPEHVVDGLRAMPVRTRGKTTPANPMLASDQPPLQPFGTILAGLGPKVSDIRFQVDLQPK